MLKRQQQSIEAYQRVQAFLNEHPPSESPQYAKLKERFDGVVERLLEHLVNQVHGKRMRHGEVTNQAAVIRRLREEHLAIIAHIARANLASAPGIEKALHMPDYYLGPLKLVAEARAIRSAAELYEDQFVQRWGLPEDFLEQLDSAVNAVEQSLFAKSRELGRQVGATAGIEMELRRGRSLIEIIDTIVRDAFRGNAELMAKWRSAKRVRALPGGSGDARSAETDTGVPTLRLVKPEEGGDLTLPSPSVSATPSPA
jgi:hypothetical protein